MRKKYFYISLSLHIVLFLLIAFFSWRDAKKVSTINPNSGVQAVQIKQFTRAKPPVKKPAPTPKPPTPKTPPAEKKPPAKKVEEPLRTKKSIPVKKEEAQQNAPTKDTVVPEKPSETKTEEVLLEEALQSLQKKEEEEKTKKEEEEIANALSGLANSTINSVELDSSDTYAEMVGAIIRSAWFFPSLGRNENFRSVVRIKVDGLGNILSYSIEESSGREDFDASAIRAVSTLKTLPPPPDAQSLDFIINFNLLEE